MSVFTVFFCGTSATSFQFRHQDFHQGELVATLARNHAGAEFADWIIADGPGSGNYQEDEKWVKPGNYNKAHGIATGAGWERNVKHALAVIKGEYQWERKKIKNKQFDRLTEDGVPLEKEDRKWNRPLANRNPDRKVTPQMLQQKKVEVQRGGAVTTVNCVGWSRGGVTCHMLANAMHNDPQLRTIPVNIFAVDPVPGFGRFQDHRHSIRDNVHNYIGIYARDERSFGFAATVPKSAARNVQMMTLPGRHSTVVGNARETAATEGDHIFTGPGLVTRHLAEVFLTQCGTVLTNTLNLSSFQLLKLYDQMIGNEAGYEEMRKHTYTKTTEKRGARKVTVGGNYKSTPLTEIMQLESGMIFINWHHRQLFQWNHGPAFDYVFNHIGGANALNAIERTYPNLYRRLGRIAYLRRQGLALGVAL